MQRPSPLTIALIAGASLVVLIAILLMVRRGDAEQDKLTGDEIGAAATLDSEKRCAGAATYDLIKRDLFRRAAQLRGSDQAAFDSLSAYAALRMDRPVMEREDSRRGIVYCSGALALDLPPGVAVAGGRRTLTADIDYTLQRAADRSGEVLTLSNADAVIVPLATLARTTAPQQPNSGPEPSLNAADPSYDGPGETPPEVSDPTPAAPPPPTPPVAQRPPPTASVRPSFNCNNARTRGERAICASAELAALDRQMAAQFKRALGTATPGERDMLERTRSRFLGYRDRCGNDACIADAYRGRMREIADIMAGRWSPPR